MPRLGRGKYGNLHGAARRGLRNVVGHVLSRIYPAYNKGGGRAPLPERWRDLFPSGAPPEQGLPMGDALDLIALSLLPVCRWLGVAERLRAGHPAALILDEQCIDTGRDAA